MGARHGALNNAMTEKLAVAQRKMERITLSIKLRGRKRNNWIRTSSTLSGWQSIDGQVTQHVYQIIDGLSERRRGPQEIGPENRVVQKHVGEMISPDSLDLHGED